MVDQSVLDRLDRVEAQLRAPRLQPLYTCDITERSSGPEFNRGRRDGPTAEDATEWPARLR